MGLFSFIDGHGDQPLTDAQVSTLLHSATGKDKAILQLILTTGIDEADLAQIRGSCIDGNCIDIYDRSLGRPRHIIMPGYVAESLKQYAKFDEPLTRLSAYKIRKRIEHLTKTALGRAYNIHTLRLTYLCRARASCPINVVSENMGVALRSIIKYWPTDYKEAAAAVDVALRWE